MEETSARGSTIEIQIYYYRSMHKCTIYATSVPSTYFFFTPQFFYRIHIFTNIGNANGEGDVTMLSYYRVQSIKRPASGAEDAW
jgi:hypothetical protein